MHKKRTLFLIALFLVLKCCLSFAQEHFNVSLTDESVPGSPFKVVGQVQLDETVAGNQLESAWGGNVVARNTSDKAILWFVASLTLIGRHNRGSVRGPRDGATYMFSDDRFFRADLIQPDESVQMWDIKPVAGHVDCCVNPVASPAPPRAEVKMRYVQFADGSTFGDPLEVKDDLALRRSILDGLQRVVRSYSQNGEQGFLTEMRKQSAWSNTIIFADVWTNYKDNGVVTAVDRAKHVLSIAEAHEASLRPTTQK